MITTKFELDISKTSQIDEAVDFAIRYKCPAIVVPPELVATMNIARGVKSGKFKIITAIDWPRGVNFGPNKFMGIDAEAIASDGFEILLTNCSPQMVKEEIKYIYDLKDGYFSAPFVDFRLILGYYIDDRTEEFFKTVLDELKSRQRPTMIRTSHLTKIPATKSTVEAHSEVIKFIKANTGTPIKISGNINAKIVAGCKNVDFYAVTPQQAKSILEDMENVNNIK